MKARFHVGHGTDHGRVRERNEDAYIVDERLGVFCVVDGMGGHAGGEFAAKIAVDEIRHRMLGGDKDSETRVREAIALANRAIYQERQRRPEFAEMACVLTLALVDGEQVTVGHVGDSRLYKIREGTLTPITHDHSPVGMLVREQRLTEVEAMRHPDRNLVLRDVGSADHHPFAPEFIDTYSFRLEPDAAMLLSSDGLSDQVTPDAILSTIRRHAHAPDVAVDNLIRQANDAGGKDNVTAILVCGIDFARRDPPRRDETTQRLGETSSNRQWQHGTRAILIALFLTVVAALIWQHSRRTTAAPPTTIYVGPEIAGNARDHFQSLQDAMAAALPGSVVRVSRGRYAGPIVLRPGVHLEAERGHDVTVFSPEGSAAVITADGLLEAAVVQGFHILANGVRDAVNVQGSWIVLKSNTISGAAETGVRATGGSTVELIGNTVHCGLGTIGVAAAGSALDVRRNRFVLSPGSPPPVALEIGQAPTDFRITYEQNQLVNCGGDCVKGISDWRAKNRVDPAPELPPGSSPKGPR